MAFALMAATAASALAAGEDVTVKIDQATIVRLPERMATIVIGNPLVADASVQPGGIMVVTGKGYGATNLVVLDRTGNVLTEKTVRVLGPQDNIVTVFRGIQRETYSCDPACERRITLGDAPEFFNTTIGQTSVRALQAQGLGVQR